MFHKYFDVDMNRVINIKNVKETSVNFLPWQSNWPEAPSLTEESWYELEPKNKKMRSVYLAYKCYNEHLSINCHQQTVKLKS